MKDHENAAHINYYAYSSSLVKKRHRKHPRMRTVHCGSINMPHPGLIALNE